MRRREALAAIAAVVVTPPAARGQLKVWRITMLDTASRDLNTRNLEAFLNRLRDLGYAEGQSLILDYRSANGRNARLSRLVRELISLNPDIILVRGTPEVVNVKAAT